MVGVLFPKGNYVNIGDPGQVAEHASSLGGEAKEIFLDQAKKAQREIEENERRKHLPRKLYSHEVRHDYSGDACVP